VLLRADELKQSAFLRPAGISSAILKTQRMDRDAWFEQKCLAVHQVLEEKCRSKETLIVPQQTIWFSLASHSASWRGGWSSLDISGRNFGRQRILLVAASPEELRDLEAALKKGAQDYR
jgi:hypothetical protein